VLSPWDALADISQQRLAKACCEMSRRDGAIVAWHEVPGKASPQKSRPVGYGVMRAGVRTFEGQAPRFSSSSRSPYGKEGNYHPMDSEDQIRLNSSSLHRASSQGLTPIVERCQTVELFAPAVLSVLNYLRYARASKLSLAPE
jgi:hypothetical protein